MPDFGALLVHIRDMRAEIARINTRVDTLSQRLVVSPSPPEVAAGLSPVNMLHEAIADCYNLAELRLLATDLGLNYEELNGSGLTDMSLSLVLHMGRHGKTAALLTELAAQRPHVNWSGYR